MTKVALNFIGGWLIVPFSSWQEAWRHAVAVQELHPDAMRKHRERLWGIGMGFGNPSDIFLPTRPYLLILFSPFK